MHNIIPVATSQPKQLQLISKSYFIALNMMCMVSGED